MAALEAAIAARGTDIFVSSYRGIDALGQANSHYSMLAEVIDYTLHCAVWENSVGDSEVFSCRQDFLCGQDVSLQSSDYFVYSEQVNKHVYSDQLFK